MKTEAKKDALAAPQERSLIFELATQYGLEPEKFMTTLKATILPQQSTNEQAAAFLIVAKQYNLNPFIREIFAFPGKGGGVVPVVSVDGWITMLNRQPALDGIEFEDNVRENELFSVTCRIYRKDRTRPMQATEYMDECRRETEPWKKWPARMLRHKALIQCARYAFGLAGIYDEDEGERIAEIGNGRRTILIGGEDKANGSTLPRAVIPAAETDPLEPRVLELCDKLGLNTAKRNMLMGQYAGKFADLVAKLEADLKSRSASPTEAATATPQTQKSPPPSSQKPNAPTFDF